MNNRRKIAYILGCLVILNLLDAVTTLYGINQGIAREANPVMIEIMKSPWIFYVGKVIIPTVALTAYIYKIERLKFNGFQETMALIVSFLAMLTYVFVNAWTLENLYLAFTQ